MGTIEADTELTNAELAYCAILATKEVIRRLMPVMDDISPDVSIWIGQALGLSSRLLERLAPTKPPLVLDYWLPGAEPVSDAQLVRLKHVHRHLAECARRLDQEIAPLVDGVTPAVAFGLARLAGMISTTSALVGRDIDDINAALTKQARQASAAFPI